LHPASSTGRRLIVARLLDTPLTLAAIPVAAAVPGEE